MSHAVELDENGRVYVEQLADAPRAHFFRRQVAAHLEPHWPRRAAALFTCGEAGARVDCADCGTAHVLPYRCGARACPTCAHTASAIACERVARRAELAALALLEPWDGIGPRRHKKWRMLHLTTAAAATEGERYDPATLRAFVLQVRRAWGKFWRSTPWGKRRNDVSKTGRRTKRVRRDTLAAMGLEVAPGGMVHIHAAVFGEFVESAEIERLWKAACPVGGWVKLKVMRDRKTGAEITACTAEGFRDALREVLKYVTKGDKELGVRAERAAVVEYALRHQRRVETCGALRLVPNVTESDVATEQKHCLSCDQAPSAWTWRGVRAPAYVQRNGGFGLSTIVDDADADARRQVDRAARLEAQQRAREAHAAIAHEYRPGGAFYGGAPPPWMDDPAEWETIDDGRGPVAWAV